MHFESVDCTVDWILKQLPREVVMATPLGLGKPNPLINAIYRRFKNDNTRELRIFTALSLAVPHAVGEMQSRFLKPFVARHWGENYPELEYLNEPLPPNIRLHEFYLQAGKSLRRSTTQRDYISVNYTHVTSAILDQGVNLIVQMIAQSPRRPGFYSLSCNPDLTLDVVEAYRKLGHKLMVVGMVHPELPYCALDAEVPADFFSAVVDPPEAKHKLFALPRQPVSAADYMIGLQASLLIEDGGTLQIGIGALGEALVHCTLLRHQNNALYREITGRLLAARPFARQHERLHDSTFATGLYGTSEMVMDGFMHLHRAGILKREIYDLDEKVRCYLHGAFYLGSNEFYAWLRELDAKGDRGFCMTRVSRVNDLYDPHEMAIRRQRVKARFFNSCMSATLLGGAASDTNEDGQVVSGVGGQYNFVAMAHELPDAFSVLMLRSTKSRTRSNFIWGHGQLTIPRHLRDVVISEYGMAFLKNRSDEQVIQAQLVLVDKQFQFDLQAKAVANLKLSPQWKIPKWAESNTSKWSEGFLAEWQSHFPAFPFGSDFTSVEERLALALTRLKRAGKAELFKIFWRGIACDPVPHRELLERMRLNAPGNLHERGLRALLLGVV